MIIFIGVDCGMFGSRNHRDSSVRELPTGVPRPAQRAVRARGFAWSPTTSLCKSQRDSPRGTIRDYISSPFSVFGGYLEIHRCYTNSGNGMGIHFALETIFDVLSEIDHNENWGIQAPI